RVSAQKPRTAAISDQTKRPNTASSERCAKEHRRFVLWPFPASPSRIAESQRSLSVVDPFTPSLGSGLPSKSPLDAFALLRHPSDQELSELFRASKPVPDRRFPPLLFGIALAT